MGYLKDTARGVFWIGWYRGSTRIISVFRTFILVRILTPADFGVVGIATILLTFLEIFTETGVNTVLIQTKEKVFEYIDTAWIVSILRGFLIAVVVYVCAPLVAAFFHNNDSVSIIRFVGFVSIARGFINPSEVLFQKNLLFKNEFLFRTTLFLVDATTAVLTALAFHSPYAIVYGLLAGAIAEVLISHLFISPHPKFDFDKEKFRYVLARGKWLTGSGIADFLFQNGDNIFVGRLLGTDMLGVYTNAYALSTLPVTEVSNILSKVTFPVFMQMNNDHKRLWSAYLKTVFSVLIITLPLALILLIFPTTIVNVFFGSKSSLWKDAIPALQILGILGVVRATVLTSYAIFLAHSKQEYVTYVAFSAAVGMLILLPFFIPMWGIVGAGFAALIGGVIGGFTAYYFVKKLIK